LATEVAQKPEIVLDDVEEDIGAKVVAIFGRKSHAPGLGGVIGHVDDQAHEAVNEVLPGSRFALNAAFQEVAVDFGECHAFDPLSIGRRRRLAGQLVPDTATGACEKLYTAP
jgi:hypothetical protein